MDEQRTRVGVGVVILKDGKLLLGWRKQGKGSYSLPGGRLEYLESFEDCAKRETREECGLEIQNIRFICLANIRDASEHWIHIGIAGDWITGEPRDVEPHKNENWKWYDLNDLPKPIFEPSRITIEAYLTGKNYFDS